MTFDFSGLRLDPPKGFSCVKADREAFELKDRCGLWHIEQNDDAKTFSLSLISLRRSTKELLYPSKSLFDLLMILGYNQNRIGDGATHSNIDRPICREENENDEPEF